jgi:arylsulfatase A
MHLPSLKICSFIAGAFLGIAPAIFAAEATRPNIVYVLADDFGYGDARCFNPDSKIPTPHIDRLAAEGMKFTDAHSGSSVCSPTRYGILTGRYAWRTKLRRGVLVPYDPPLIAADRLTVPGFLKQHGYHTGCVGKWHLGWEWPLKDGQPAFDGPVPGGPCGRGFDYYFGPDVPNHPPYIFRENDRFLGVPSALKETRDLNGRPGPMLPGWKFDAILPALAEKSAAYIDARAKDKQPFFLYVPLTSPHEPVAPSAAFRGKSGISDLADFLMETDWVLGEVLAALDRNKLVENTLVFFTCDNGHATYTGLPALERAGHKVSGPLKGYKTNIWEGGHRVPFVARWPGQIKPAASCTQTICHTNLLATCAEVLGAKLPENAGEDSFSILPLLRGAEGERPATPAVVHQAADGTLAIRQGKWKLVMRPAVAMAKGASADQLYDLEADLAETRNVAADNSVVVRQLTELLQKYIDNGRSAPGPAQKNDVPVPIRVAAAAGKKK